MISSLNRCALKLLPPSISVTSSLSVRSLPYHRDQINALITSKRAYSFDISPPKATKGTKPHFEDSHARNVNREKKVAKGILLRKLKDQPHNLQQNDQVLLFSLPLSNHIRQLKIVSAVFGALGNVCWSIYLLFW